MGIKPNVRGTIVSMECGDIVTFPLKDVRSHYVRSTASTVALELDRRYSVSAIKGTGKVVVTRIS